MPFIKRYPDGSVFDYTHGHRTAEQVAREKAEGKYSEPSPEASNKTWGTALLLTGVLLASGGLWNFTTNIVHDKQNKEAIVAQLESTTRSEVLKTKDNNKILLRASQDHEFSEGESAAEHALHTVIVPCETEEFVENDQPFAAVFCEGFEGSLVVELPHK